MQTRISLCKRVLRYAHAYFVMQTRTSLCTRVFRYANLRRGLGPIDVRRLYRGCCGDRVAGIIQVKALRSRADVNEHMIMPFRPTSNTERQRQFRERNPGYYGRLRRRVTASASVGQLIEVEQAAAVRREPLMLPAPAMGMGLFSEVENHSREAVVLGRSVVDLAGDAQHAAAIPSHQWNFNLKLVE
jgi:hypothetical protein